MDENMEFKIRQVMSGYHKRKWAGVAVCVTAVLYLVYLEIFRMDYRISLVVGVFASLLLTLSVFLVYFGLAVVMILLLRSAALVISRTLADDCDPFLYEACLHRLTVLFYKDRMACNVAVAQYFQGDFSRAWDTLQRINVYKLKGTFKLNYYTLLCALDFENDSGETAAELERAFRAGIRNKKDQKYFQMLCAGNNVCRAMKNQDYEAAFRFIKEREKLNGNLSCRWHRVSFSMKEAAVYAALGENESARLHLQYVIENGGRLFCVEEARRLMEKISRPMEQAQEKTSSRLEEEKKTD